MVVWIPALLVCNSAGAPVELARVFTTGTTLSHRVESHLMTEKRVTGLNTWMPEELDINYNFTLDVGKETVDGIHEIRYRRPKMEQIIGETFDSPPVRTEIKTGYDFLLTVTPVNSILDTRDMSKPPAKQNGARWFGPLLQGNRNPELVDGLMDEIYRLALFAGNMESALDLAPALPVDRAEPGAQWKRTVGYSPQILTGSDGKSAVQRLDYTYTYKGLVPVQSGKAHRVFAELNLDTDVAPFIHQATGLKPAQTKLKSLKLKLKASIEFDLDPKSLDTMQARARSEGGIATVLTTQPDRPVYEERLKSRTILKIVSKVATSKSPKRSQHTHR